MDDNCSCGCIVAVLVLSVIWRLSVVIGKALSIGPGWVFLALILIIVSLFYYNYLLRQSNMKMQSKFEEIMEKYPKAYAKYVAGKGYADNAQIPNSFKKEVVKKTDDIWKKEEQEIIDEEKEQRRKEAEEKQLKLIKELKLLEKQFPNGVLKFKEKNVGCTIECLVLNKSQISKLEDEFQAEQKQKRKEELIRKKAEERIKLGPSAHNVLVNKAKNWEHLYGNLNCTWLFYYYPTNCEFDATPKEWEDRRTIWNFKNDPSKSISTYKHLETLGKVIPQIKQKLIDTFGEEYLQFLTLVCIPASTSEKNRARYEEFSSWLCAETGMENGYSHVQIVKDGLSKNAPGNTTGRSCQPEVIIDDWFKGKYILLFDDVITMGDTMRRYKNMMERKGSFVIGGIAIGKTKHHRPEPPHVVSNGFDNIFGDDDSMPF